MPLCVSDTISVLDKSTTRASAGGLTLGVDARYCSGPWGAGPVTSAGR